MSIFSKKEKRPQVKFNKPTIVSWDSFRLGLNQLFLDSELKKEEVREMTNLWLVGSGIVTPRPGSANFFLGGASGMVRALKSVYFSNGTREVLALTDNGFLNKKSGASYSRINGASFASGYNAEMVQLNDKVYVVNGINNLVRYDGTSLVPYSEIGSPTSPFASKSSGASGLFTRSYRISAETEVGETLAAASVALSNCPESWTTFNYAALAWTRPSSASGMVKGYVIYGRVAGEETYLTRVPGDVTRWDDTGDNEPSFIAGLPDANTTGGPIGKFVVVHKEKLVMGNINGHKSRITWDGGGINTGKFHWSKGGGFRDIDADSGEEITGIADFKNSIIVFKTRSVWQVVLTFDASLGITVPTVTNLTRAVGCVAHRTIKQVENDLFFMGRRAGKGVSLNSLGNEANYVDALRTAEISSKVSPILEGISPLQAQNMVGHVWRNVYWLDYPEGSSSYNTRRIGYDRERLSWNGPHTISGQVQEIFYDISENEHFMFGSATTGMISEFSTGYSNDNGVDFEANFLTKKEDFGAPVTFKTLKSLFVWLRSVTGAVQVNVIIEGRDGQTTTTKNFTVTATATIAGWGSRAWGGNGVKAAQWGKQPSTGTTNSNEVVKYLALNKPARNVQIQVKKSGSGSFKLLLLEMDAKVSSRLNIPSSYRV